MGVAFAGGIHAGCGIRCQVLVDSRYEMKCAWSPWSPPMKKNCRVAGSHTALSVKPKTMPLAPLAWSVGLMLVVDRVANDPGVMLAASDPSGELCARAPTTTPRRRVAAIRTNRAPRTRPFERLLAPRTALLLAPRSF